jgi:hypothetical protein
MAAKDRWTLRNIYLYLVCLITLIMLIVAVVSGVRAVVQIVYPQPVITGATPAGETPAKGGPTASDIEFQRENDRRNAILDVVGSVAMVLVAGPVYLYHWRRIERDIAEESVTDAAA